MNKPTVLWCALGLLALSAGSLSGQCLLTEGGDLIQSDGTPCANTIITAVPFLRIVPDARFGALGDAGMALSPDPNSLHFNASNLVFAEKDLGVSATFTPWLRALGLNDVFLAYLSSYLILEGKGGKKMDDRRMQALGMSLRFFSLGQIQYTDEQGNALQTVRPRELEFLASYSRKLGKRFSTGLGIKYIYSNLGNGANGTDMRPAHAFAADVSFTYRQPLKIGESTGSLNFGLAFNNLGNKISYTRSANRDYIPANFGIGTAFEYNIDKHNSITAAFDINKLMVPTPTSPVTTTGVNPKYDEDQDGVADYKQQSVPASIFTSFGDAPGGVKEEFRELMLSFGMEYWYNKLFAVRAGYYFEDKRKGARQFMTVGVGIRYNIFNINFSYLIPSFGAQRNPLDNTLRFSLLFEFSRLKKEKQPTPLPTPDTKPTLE